jgi:hypothetical protein
MNRLFRTALLAVVIVFGFTGAASAQKPVTLVIRLQDLGFGSVFPGVQTTVQPMDAGAGRYFILGRRNQHLELDFVFPPNLTSGGGASMPVTFGPTSAAYSADGSTASLVPFDPNTPFKIRLSRQGIGYVYLGGTLQPGGGQAAGNYTGKIILSVN